MSSRGRALSTCPAPGEQCQSRDGSYCCYTVQGYCLSHVSSGLSGAKPEYAREKRCAVITLLFPSISRSRRIPHPFSRCPSLFSAADRATNDHSVFEELAPMSPLKKVKSFHFPLGSSRSLAVSAAANSTTSSTRGSGSGSDGGQEGGGRSGGGGRGGARFGAQGTLVIASLLKSAWSICGFSPR